MKVFIARHGEASFDAPSDFERNLTQKGEATTQRLVDSNLEQLKSVSEIWCSHLTRAVQTADIYARALSLKPQRQTFLTPDSSPAQVLRKLEKHADIEAILLVSHQPLVGDLTGLLCGNGYGAHPFATSEVVVLEMDYPAQGMASKIANFLP